MNTEVVINGGTFDATIGGTNNAMINVSEDAVVTIPVTYTYFWGELTDEIQVVFKKPVVKE